MNSYTEILKNFEIEIPLSPYGDGHINQTFISAPFIVQRINTDIFKNPESLMQNIWNVTEHIKAKVKEAGGEVDRSTLSIVPAKGGKLFHIDSEGKYWRVYKFIDKAKTYNRSESPDMMYNAAKAIGKFQNLLADFDSEKLTETIPDFHNTKMRLAQLEEAIANNKAGRLDSVSQEVKFFLDRADFTTVVLDKIADGSVPLRVTHNDTKLNNIMIDDKTEEGICLIDLDTVMPGSFLYDFGDSLRFGASTADEDERDLSKVNFDIEIYKQFTDGYLSQVKNVLTPAEAKLLPHSVKLMTMECGMRFLADHLNGDTYFAIHRENHNLDRARTQIKLIQDMEAKFEEMVSITENLLRFEPA